MLNILLGYIGLLGYLRTFIFAKWVYLFFNIKTSAEIQAVSKIFVKRLNDIENNNKLLTTIS